MTPAQRELALSRLARWVRRYPDDQLAALAADHSISGVLREAFERELLERRAAAVMVLE